MMLAMQTERLNRKDILPALKISAALLRGQGSNARIHHPGIAG